ncbi:MAG TPA: hypothetical protein PKA51_09935, partial [Kiritimatiellia bacterium]|nr:hypothetical protein [Kiritimatiellia bacterium]
FARDLGPQFAESTIRTNNTIVAIPIGETGRFMPQYLVLRGVPAGSTQAISYVASGHTGVVSAATTASLIALTNIPPMFFGDYFLVVPNGLSSTNTFKARTIGAVFD